jgi:hypothetical protein
VVARCAALAAIKSAGTGLQECNDFRTLLPTSLVNSELKIFHSAGWDDLQKKVNKSRPSDELEIIKTLISELNECYSLDLGPGAVPIARDAEAEALPAVVIAVVGASNAARLVAVLEDAGLCAHHITVPSWRPNTAVIAEALADLSKVQFQDPDSSMIVLYNLDNAAYYALTIDGSLIPSKRLDGHYHLDGDLVVAPKEQFQHTLKVCLPLINFRPDIKKVVLSPMPRYWVGKCCDDTAHIPNFHNLDYEKILFDDLSDLRRATKDFLFMQRVKNLAVVNPFLTFGNISGRHITPEAINAVHPIWGDDPVHPSYECVDRLATFLSNMMIPAKQEDQSAASTTTERSGQPFKRLKSATEPPSSFVTPRTPGGNSRSRPWFFRGSGGRGGHGGHRGRGGRRGYGARGLRG